MDLESGKVSFKKVLPNAQEMIAKSHFMAGTLFNPRTFEGHFSGVFGDFKGAFIRVFSEQEINQT